MPISFFDVDLHASSGNQTASIPGRLANRIMRAGISGHDRESRRRLAVTTLTGVLACVSCLTFAAAYSVYDFSALKWVVVVNLVAAVIAVSISFWHRFGSTVATIVLATTIYTTVFFYVFVLGRDSGIHLNYVGASAIVFVLLGLSRIRLILVIVLSGLALNIMAQLMFARGYVQVDDWFISCLYIISATTIIGIVGFIVWFAFRVAAEAEEPIADRFDEASVLFADIVGFTPMSIELSPEKMIEMLNRIFSSFDRICSRLGTEKIKTIGDAYMVASGVPDVTDQHAQKIAELAIGMQKSIQELSENEDTHLQLRIGIATGPITAGVIGRANCAYDVWAPTVNLAARLERHGKAGRIHVSDETKRALDSFYDFELAPAKDIKGIGRLKTWYLIESTTNDGDRDTHLETSTQTGK